MNTPGAIHIRHCAGISRSSALLWALLLGGGAIGLAYFLWPTGNPSTPSLVGPAGTLLRGHIPTTTLGLTWRHGGVRTLNNRTPGRAYRFVICFFEANTAHDCAAGTGTIHVADRQASALQRTEIRPAGFLSSAWHLLDPAYEYTDDVALPQTALDIALSWTVGACSRPTNDSCSFAEPLTTALTARNLVATRIDPDTEADGVVFHVEVRNDGETTTGSFRIQTTVWEVIGQAGSSQALTDVNDTAAATATTVITAEGRMNPIVDYRNGSRPASEVWAIQQPGTSPTVWVSDHPVPTPHPTAPASLAPCPSTPPCKVASTQHPGVLAAHLSVDPAGVLWEFDETDNTSARKNIYAP